MEELIARKLTKTVKVGKLSIGGKSPITLQSMTNTKTSDISATKKQVSELVTEGCEMVRLAVPDLESASALEKIVKFSPVPIIADIHFDAQLAIRAIESGAAKVRINPGNIGGKKNLLELAKKAANYNVAIRIGINSGSLEKDIQKKYGAVTPEALVHSAMRCQEYLEDASFSNLVFSLKASTVYTTISAYRLFSESSDYPLHIGVTEAGPPSTGLVKSAIGIGTLLAEGIGDTVRVSLTAHPVEEVKAAKNILQALGIRQFGAELISCPTCGRCEADLQTLTSEVEKILKGIQIPIKVAVMGCIVNGPGEAREADIGISAGKKQGVIFCQGKVIKTVKTEILIDSFKQELRTFLDTANHANRGGPNR